MNNLLIIDDSPERQNKLIGLLSKSFNCTIASTVDSAIYALETSDFYMILMDHDLGDIHPEKNGAYIAYFIVKNNLCKNTHFIIHSVNPIGSQNIKLTLDKNNYSVDVIPYPNFISFLNNWSKLSKD